MSSQTTPVNTHGSFQTGREPRLGEGEKLADISDTNLAERAVPATLHHLYHSRGILVVPCPDTDNNSSLGSKHRVDPFPQDTNDLALVGVLLHPIMETFNHTP